MHPPNILLLLIHLGSVGCLYTYQKLKVKRLEDVRHHVKSEGIAPSQCNCSTPHCWECRPRSRRYGPYMLRQGCLDQMDLTKLVMLKLIVSSLKRMRKWRVMSNSSSKLTELYVHWHIIELKRTGGRYTYESQTLGPTQGRRRRLRIFSHPPLLDIKHAAGDTSLHAPTMVPAARPHEGTP
jgi:hypothetical protein